MNNQILCAVSGPVNLNKMVPAAQCAKTALQTLCVFQTAVTAQIRQVETLLPPLPDIHSGRNKMRGGIHLLHIHLNLSQIDRVHPAANIDAHYIGHGFVCNCHGGTDGAALPGVDIRHNADTASRRELIVAHSANLPDGLLLNDFGKAERGIHFPLDFQHNSPSRCLNVQKPPAPYKADGCQIHFIPMVLRDHRAILLCLICAHDKTVQIIKTGRAFGILFI